MKSEQSNQKKTTKKKILFEKIKIHSFRCIKILNQKLKLTIMANKAMIQRELKRQRLVMKHAKKRSQIKEQMKSATSLREKLTLHRKLQQLPKNSSPVRLHNRCTMTGRPKGYFRDFGLSRHVLREMAHQGVLPGVKKSSW